MRGPHAVFFALVVACGTASSPPPEVPRAQPYAGALVDLVPADSHEILFLRPAEPLGDPTTRPLLDAIAPSSWRRALGDRTGVYAEDVSELVLCRWADESWWAFVRVPRAEDVVRAATPRMAPVEVEAEAPFVRRIGYLAEERYELVALTDELLLVAHGRPGDVITLLRALADPRATRVPPERPTILHSEAPLWLALPHPLELPIDTPVGLLLARQTALRIDARPPAASPTGSADPSAGSPASSPPDHLRATMLVQGELPEGAEENFRALLRALASTDLGRVLALPEALPSLAIARRPDGVSLTADFPADLLARGIRLVFRAEISEIVGEPSDDASL